MVDEKILTKVFRAAACGVMEPFAFRASDDVHSMQPYSGASYDHAKSMAGAFNAIADIFEKVGEAADMSQNIGAAFASSPNFPQDSIVSMGMSALFVDTTTGPNVPLPPRFGQNTATLGEILSRENGEEFLRCALEKYI